MCVKNEMKVPALDEREGQMKHVVKVNVCDRREKSYADKTGKVGSTKKVIWWLLEREDDDAMSNVQYPTNS